MALESRYKILFFLQTAIFITFVINYSPTVRKTSATVSEVCKCREKDISKTNQQVDGKPETDIATAIYRQNNVARGKFTNCSLADIKKKPGVVMLTTTNFGFLDILLNMFESIKRIGVCVNTTIIAEDQRVYEFLSKRAEGDPGVIVLKTNSGETLSKEISRYKNKRAYYGLMNKRQAYVLALLEQGREVLFTDSDTFWFRDPFPYFQGDFDMSMIDSANPYPVRNSRANFCAGFVYFKPTNVTITFVKSWIQAMAANIQRGKVVPDQTVMNGLLNRDKPVHVDIKPLDTYLFPWGPEFYRLLQKDANYSAVVMHAASIRERAAKIKKFKSSNMWLVNNKTEGLESLR